MSTWSRVRFVCSFSLLFFSELGQEELPRVMEVGREDVFQQDAKAGTGGAQSESAAERTRSDHCNGLAVFGLMSHG